MPRGILGCGTTCGIPSDVDFGLKPIVDILAVSAAARFVSLVGTATNLLFEHPFLLQCWQVWGA